MEIKYIQKGIAFRSGDTIYVNEKLNNPKYAGLKALLIAHESQHTQSVKLIDLLLDLRHSLFNDPLQDELKKFCNDEHISLLEQFSPFIKIDGEWGLIPFRLILWLIGIIALGVIIWRI